MSDANVFARSESAVVESNKLIKNTYTLLSFTLLFSAAMSGLSMLMEVGRMHWAISLIGMFGLLFLVYKTSNSVMGLFSVFAFTGFMGFVIGPTIGAYMNHYSNGGQIVMLTMGMTGAIFLGLSAYVLTTKKDFSFLSSFLVAGMIMVVLMIIVGFFFAMPALHLAISGAIVMLMCGFILMETSELVNGQETNYIIATVGLYLSIINLFMSLLHLLMAFMGED